MSDYPNPGKASPSVRLARHIDRICDRFEAVLKAGRRPRLERFLSKSPTPVQAVLLRELMLLELDYRHRKGEAPQPEEYHHRFPQHTELIDAVFSEVGPSTPSTPYLLRRWTVSRLVSQLQMLVSPQEQGKVPRPDVLSLVAGILSRTEAKDSRAPGEAVPAASELGPSTRLLDPGKASSPFQDEAGPDSQTPTVTFLGDYELLEQLGKGGMGVVYRARQRSTRRIVALKIIRADRLEHLTDGERHEWFERFRREGQIAACLHHDNLVTIYEMGRADGQHFYSMRFVEGQSLADILRQGPLSNQRAALYLEPVARALHALHAHGIVHRDLKPRNILIDCDDRPFLTDFGLAKWSEYTQGLTQLEECLGTPEYMAPEQARNPAKAQAASDLYSLGATLYELLAGRPPFRAADPVETRRQVLEQDPLPPRRLNPAVHRDLELICLKCLEKEPQKRYANALQVAEEFRRYRTGEPLRHTRAVGHSERAWRWCRRKPFQAAVAGLAAVVLMAVTALVISVAFVFQLRVETEQKQIALDEADTERREANRLNNRLTTLSALEQGAMLCEKGDVARGLLWLAHSLELDSAEPSDFDNLIRTNLASWSHLLSPLRAILPHDEPIVAVAFSRDGQMILTASSDKVQLWDTATRRPIGRSVDVPGEALPAGSAPGQGPLFTASVLIPGRISGCVLAAALSFDGRMILTGCMDNTARLWDAPTGRLLGSVQHNNRVSAVAFRPDGKAALTGSWDETARLWDIASGQPIGEPLPHRGPVLTVSFSPDGKMVLTGSAFTSSKGGEARLWDVATGRLLQVLPHQGKVWAAALSPDGKTVLTASADGTGHLWEAATGQPLGGPFRLGERVMALAFSPDGNMVLTGSLDRTAQLWDVKTRLPVGPRLHHRGGITCLAFSPDGKFLLTGSEDETARLWEARSTELHRLSLPHQGEIHAAAFSQNSKLVVTAGGELDNGWVQIWDVATGKPHVPALQHQGMVRAVAFSPDGKTLLTGGWEKFARLWDVDTGRLRHALPHRANVWAVAYSGDGRIVLTGSLDGTAQLWNAETGKRHGLPLHHGAEVYTVAFSPDDRLVVTGGLDGTAQVWNPATSQRISILRQHRAAVWTATFSSDGRFVLTGSLDGTAQLWDAITGDRLFLPLRHQSHVWAVAFSPDDSLILTGSDDHTARLWKFGTDRARSALEHLGLVRTVAFSSDGRLVLTGSDDKTAQLWDAATGRPCGPPLQHQGMIGSAIFSPDGKMLLTGGTSRTARLWEVPVPVKVVPVKRVVLWTNVITGMELDDSGAIHVLDPQAWNQVRHDWEESGEPPVP